MAGVPQGTSPRWDLREYGDGVSHADEVVGAEGSPYRRSTQVLVLVFTQSRDGLRGQAEKVFNGRHLDFPVQLELLRNGIAGIGMLPL